VTNVPDFPRACTSYEEHLSALIDGELTVELELAVRSHVDSCPHCSAHCDALRRVDGLLVEVPAREVPADLRQRLAARIEADREAPELHSYAGARKAEGRAASPPERVRRAQSYRWAQPVAVFAAAAAAAALVLYWTVRSGEPSLPDAPVAPPVARTDPEPALPTTPEPIPAPTPAPTPAPVVPREETIVAETPPSQEALVAETPPEVDLDSIDEDELALALEIEMLEDLDVIANLDLLTRLVELEEEAG
jgi:anti-sigma factor (TIGR02949 family)